LKNKLPVQQLPEHAPIAVWQLPYRSDELAHRHHRHQFFMLLWVTAGSGEHQVNFRSQPLAPGRVLFVQEGQAHRVVRQPESGWLILFHADIFRRHLRQHPADEQHGLFDYLGDRPTIDLDPPTRQIFKSLLPLLAAQAGRDPHDPIAADYISILLHAANRLHQPIHPVQLHPAQAEQVRQLKMLIERHYLNQRHAPFYAQTLGLAARKLNYLSRQLTGRNVDELVEGRIISEAEALLGGTPFTVKEIAFRLGFLDQSHFAYFFKKRRGISPRGFRDRQRSGF
jgi:AraC family transcriptional regulator, transcriptional activator of pobA